MDTKQCAIESRGGTTMLARTSTRKTRQIYEFIEANRNACDVTTMYRSLDVTRGGFYAWLKHPLLDRAQEDARLLGLIRASFAACHGTQRARRVLLDLREAGETCSKHRVARLMRSNNFRAGRGYWVRRQPAAKAARPLNPGYSTSPTLAGHVEPPPLERRTALIVTNRRTAKVTGINTQIRSVR